MNTPAGFVQRQHNREKDHDLRRYRVTSYHTSIKRVKPFRPEQRVHQINEEKDRRNSCNCIFHYDPRLKPFGRLRKAPHQDEENKHDRDIEQIQHDSPHNRQKHHVVPCLF